MSLRDELNEAKETIREQRFKLEAYGIMAAYSLENLPEDKRARLENGLYRLAMCHTRGEHPLDWRFDDARRVLIP